MANSPTTDLYPPPILAPFKNRNNPLNTSKCRINAWLTALPPSGQPTQRRPTMKPVWRENCQSQKSHPLGNIYDHQLESSSPGVGKYTSTHTHTHVDTVNTCTHTQKSNTGSCTLTNIHTFTCKMHINTHTHIPSRVLAPRLQKSSGTCKALPSVWLEPLQK